MKSEILPNSKISFEATKVRRIAKTLKAHKQREGGGFIVRRPVGGEISDIGPFLMLDHMGPATYAPGEAIGAPDHPHRGFETVTYMLQGEFSHLDSVGNRGTLKDGWCQWMTAGSGVVHSEMPSDKIIKEGGTIEGFQLWVNLPKKYKMIPPRYQDTPAEDIPVASTDDGKVTVKIIAGESLNKSAIIDTKTPIIFLDIHMSPGASFTQTVPSKYAGFVYCYRGEGSLGSNNKTINEGMIGVLGDDGNEISMSANVDSEFKFLLLAGEPINEPIARYGPIVMNTMDEIRQAFDDYRSGKFGEIAGSEARYAATAAAKSKQKETGSWNNAK